MYDDAYKQQPANEELGTQTFFANVRIGNWKAAQQVRKIFYAQILGGLTSSIRLLPRCTSSFRTSITCTGML